MLISATAHCAVVTQAETVERSRKAAKIDFILKCPWPNGASIEAQSERECNRPVYLD